ncbi:MAG TPA: PPC domain-containing DNA-binding protein [Candidatus Limnocylindria bacterium]|nr:PPC domain-containing DNA-binding protein [Candidatus Limnocylindria bacterium]
MTYRFDGYNWLVRLEKDELLVESLTKLVKDQKITGAWISGLGGAQWAELGFYNLGKQAYEWKRFDELLEITSLQGNVTWEGDEPVIHMHGTLSGQNMQAVGGHVKELQVAGTCEVLLHRWYEQQGLKRQQDPDTGLKLLDL